MLSEWELTLKSSSARAQLEREYAKVMERAGALRKALEALNLLDDIMRVRGAEKKRVGLKGSIVMRNGRRMSEAGRRAISRAAKARHAADKQRKKKNG